MKRSDIEKKLRKELDRSSPSDFNDVRRRCGLSTEAEMLPITEGAPNTAFRRNGISIAAILLVFAMILGIAALALTFIPNNDGILKPTGSGYVIIDINPTLEIHYDKNGKVTNAKALNEDAEVLLNGLSLNGKNYKKATNMIFTRCVELGYFSYDRDTNAILASACFDSGSADELLTKEIKKLISNAFSSYKMRGVVITGVNDPALVDEAATYGIDAQKYALILSYLSIGGTLDTERYSEISVSDLYSLISEKQTEIKKAKVNEKKAASAENATIISDMLSVKIGLIIDELRKLTGNSVGHGKEEKNIKYYSECILSLESLANQLPESKTEDKVKRITTDFLSELTNLKMHSNNETLKTFIDSIYIEISAKLAELQSLISVIDTMSMTPSEKNGKRKDKFASAEKPQKSDSQLKGWQKAHENEYASDWYNLKQTWNAERAHDLD